MFRILIPGGRVVIVPEGRLEGEGFLRRLISWLFIITGQRFDLEKDGGASELWPRIQNRFLEEGFKVAIERVHLEDSSATIVILDKPFTNN
jgi:hypothetical protein